MTDRQITRIWIYLLLALVLAVALWGCIQLVNVSAAPACASLEAVMAGHR